MTDADVAIVVVDAWVMCVRVSVVVSILDILLLVVSTVCCARVYDFQFVDIIPCDV